MSIDARDLLVLLALARSQTYSAAARQLGVTHTTVLRHLRSLEREAGDKLFAAGPGGWELTHRGQDLLPAAQAIENALADAESKLTPLGSGEVHGRVRIRTAEAFGGSVVAPAIGRIRSRHPGISFDVRWAVRPLTDAGLGGDLNFQLAPPVDSAKLLSRKVMDFELGLFATRDYLEAHGTPRRLDDLKGHSPIYYADQMRRHIGFEVFATLFQEGADPQTATTVSGHVALTAAGAGIGVLPTYVASRRPDLVPVLPDDVRLPLSVWMIARVANLRRPEVRLAAEAIEHEAARIARRD